MSHSAAGSKVGVYVDVANMYRNGGQRLQYDILREFACRDHADPVRLNAYVSYDLKRAKTDFEYRARQENFHSALRDLGYKVIVKEVQWFMDDNREWVGKANADLDLAVDALLQSENLDRVLLVSGDGDFTQVVRALQNKGCRVEVVALHNVSRRLREEADLFMSGFLIPGLIPLVGNDGDREASWGEAGSRVRGWCYWHHRQESWGFLRFLKHISPGLWVTDTRNPDSPYDTAFLHDSNLPDGIRGNDLPSRNHILEFTLTDTRQDERMEAREVTLVSRL